MRLVFLIAFLTTLAPVTGAQYDQRAGVSVDRPTPVHPPIPYELIEARIVANMERLGLERANGFPDRMFFV